MTFQTLTSFGPLPIRILAGITFIAHGLPKLSDISGTGGFFASVGLPSELALPIMLLEIIGGIALLVGVLTRIAAGIFIIEMIGVILNVKLSKGFVGGYELELLLIAISISLLLTGPGRLSIERDLLKRELVPKGKDIVLQQQQQQQ
jgi:putative oxidoreductase